MSKEKDKEILEGILQSHPPINPHILNKWEQQAERSDVKGIICQWKSVIYDAVPMIDMDLFQRCQKLLDTLNVTENE